MYVESLGLWLQDLPCDKSNSVSIKLKHPLATNTLDLRGDHFVVDQEGNLYITVDIEEFVNEIQRAARSSSKESS